MRIRVNDGQKKLKDVSFTLDIQLNENQNKDLKLCCNFDVKAPDVSIVFKNSAPIPSDLANYIGYDSKLDNIDHEHFIAVACKELNSLIENENLPFYFQIEKSRWDEPDAPSIMLTIQRKTDQSLTSSADTDDKSLVMAQESKSKVASNQLNREDTIKLYEFLKKQKLVCIDEIGQTKFVLKIDFFTRWMLNPLDQVKETPNIFWLDKISRKVPIIHEHNQSLRQEVLSFFNERLGGPLGGALVALNPIIEYAEAGVPEYHDQKSKERQVTLPIQSEEIFFAFGKVLDEMAFKERVGVEYDNYIKTASWWECFLNKLIDINQLSKPKEISRSAYCALGKIFCDSVNGKTPDSIPDEVICGIRQFEHELFKEKLKFTRKLYATRIYQFYVETALYADHPEESELDNPFSIASEVHINSNFVKVTQIYLAVLKELGIKMEYSLPKENERRSYIRLHYQAKEELLKLDKSHNQTKSPAALISAISPIYSGVASDTPSVAPATPDVKMDAYTEVLEVTGIFSSFLPLKPWQC